MVTPAVLLGASTAAEEVPPRPTQRSQEKTLLPWHCRGRRTPASSTQRSVSRLGVGHPVTAPCRGCAGLSSVFLPLCGVISHPAWTGGDPGLVINTRLGYKFIFIQCQTRAPPCWSWLHRSLWLVAFRFQTLSPHAKMPIPPLPPLLPAAPQGQRRRRWLYRADRPPGIALPLSAHFAPPCSRLDLSACGCEADGLVAWLVILLAVVHAGHHHQNEGLWDQQLHVHLWKR